MVYHNYMWLVNSAPVNLIENVLTDFLKNLVSKVPFSISTDVVPYL